MKGPTSTLEIAPHLRHGHPMRPFPLPGLILIVSLCGIQPALAATILNLSATGTASAAPDMTQASLRIETNAPDAARAQILLNQLMQSAIDAARALSGVVATTSDYNVAPVYPAQKIWQANASLSLTYPKSPADAAPFLQLIGRLQQKNLQLQSLQGALSPAARTEVRSQATLSGLKNLQTQAADIARALGDQVSSIQTLNISADQPVFPLMRMEAVSAMAVAAPPVAAPSPITQLVTLSASVKLDPVAH
ncbi:MAG TPA: SIMPL domain-containing protein [Acetobacteraceae bacterium]|nr:SIMPL domain-containing protein [Acetobacteraceae bacterium]